MAEEVWSELYAFGVNCEVPVVGYVDLTACKAAMSLSPVEGLRSNENASRSRHKMFGHGTFLDWPETTCSASPWDRADAGESKSCGSSEPSAEMGIRVSAVSEESISVSSPGGADNV